MRLKLVVAFFALLVAANPARTEEPADVSMIQLIATPSRYQGKLVRLIAFLRVEFEGNALYFHQDDYVQGITKNGLWIVMPDQLIAKSKALDQGYVIVVGTFDAKNKGHKGLWSGSISKIHHLEKWQSTK
jgi:hypothetical protein